VLQTSPRGGAIREFYKYPGKADNALSLFPKKTVVPWIWFYRPSPERGEDTVDEGGKKKKKKKKKKTKKKKKQKNKKKKKKKKKKTPPTTKERMKSADLGEGGLVSKT